MSLVRRDSPETEQPKSQGQLTLALLIRSIKDMDDGLKEVDKEVKLLQELILQNKPISVRIWEWFLKLIRRK